MKGIFIPEITVEMFRNGCLESIEILMTEGEIYDIEYDHKSEESDVPDIRVGKWIPCSERMPDEHEWLGTKKFGTTISDEVYVTFENPKGERFCKHLRFQNKKLSGYDQQTIDAFYKGSKPIAWMPLPEPYKKGEQDD